ncbi:AbrB family transcriptional regulator [Metabacillus litoralis]|uniref:AbrB family transcriptional regulator n=1 Tax=Metabacillus litoralis TaxID=152268 RepID=UPI001CFEA990|nr:AbrB family transcriptional regulator [Metabacillus litoralis]
MKNNTFNIVTPYFIGIVGGLFFHLCQAPLAWILGPMCFLIVFKSFSSNKKHRHYYQPSYLKNGSFIILGISFGLSFTKETFLTVGPYAIPFLFTTILLITISIINGIFISKLVNIDRNTSIFASVPGGLTEMVAASESLNANASLVTIFQTVRLLAVVFIVPFTIIQLFEPSHFSEMIKTSNHSSNLFSFTWFILAGFVGWLLKSKLPASYVIGPLLSIALLNIIGISLPEFHEFFFIFAQLSIGVSFGLMISFADLKKGGIYCGLYLVTTIILIVASLGGGYLFALFTKLDLATAMLSFAPGGLVEMVLTASTIGANPAVVSSLQFIRLLFIIGIVPSVLKHVLRTS